MSEPLDGLVIKSQSGFHTVRVDGEEVVCRLRGRITKTRLDTDPVAVGDRVQIQVLPDGTGMIETVKERERALARMAPSGRDVCRWDRDGYLL